MTTHASARQRAATLALRLLTLSGRMVLVVALARFLSPAELGQFGLLSAIVLYALYPFGLEFYAYSNRAMLRAEPRRWWNIVGHHAVLLCVTYALFGPITLVLFLVDVLPKSFAHWFFLLLIVEHACQEMGRLLTATNDQLFAGVVQFFRTASWVIVLVPVIAYAPHFRTLQAVLLAWWCGAVLAAIAGAARIHATLPVGDEFQLDTAWIRRGVVAALPLLFATLALRGLFVFDRVLFEATRGLEALGAYVVFMSVGNVLLAVQDATVLSFLYPRLIHAHVAGDRVRFAWELRQALVWSVGLVAVCALPALQFRDFWIPLLGQPLFLQMSYLLPWILLATLIYAVSLVPHFGLYALGLDKQQLACNIGGLLAFLSAAVVFSFLRLPSAIPISLALASVALLISKALLLQRAQRSWKATALADDSHSAGA